MVGWLFKGREPSAPVKPSEPPAVAAAPSTPATLAPKNSTPGQGVGTITGKVVFKGTHASGKMAIGKDKKSVATLSSIPC